MNHLTPKQSGFTLVEISIVLVIIGLLLGGVLKGQAMIENGKVKALAAEMRGVSTMINAYRDLYKALPGDDKDASLHQPGATSSTTKQGSGQIDTGDWIGAAAVDATKETTLFWQQVRLAGLATGSATSGEATNSVDGKLGVTSGILRPNSPPNVSGSYYVCSGKIPGKLARALDIAMDDGSSDEGKMFAAIETAGAPVITATAPPAGGLYDEANTYTVCLAQ